MDIHITREMIDKWRKYLKAAEPYSEEDNHLYDGEWNPARQAATSSKMLLEYFGMNPYDDDDYGIY